MTGEWEIDGDKRCPDCGAGVLKADVWDDPTESGGALIAVKYRCAKDCGWEAEVV